LVYNIYKFFHHYWCSEYPRAPSYWIFCNYW